MHELSLCRSLLAMIERQAAAEAFERVTRVRLEVGALSAVEPAALRFGFVVASRGTLAEGATLEIAAAAGEAWCRDCGRRLALERWGQPCPCCGSYDLEVRGGDALRLSELEVL